MASIIEIEAYYSSAWNDISNIFLKVGNFDILYNNFDFSLRSNVMSCTFSNEKPALVSRMTKIRIMQYDKIVFLGYVKKIEYLELFKKYDIIIASMIDYMDEFKVIEADYKTLFDANCDPEEIEVGTGYTGYPTLSLFPYIFNYFTGYDLVLKDIALESGNFPYILVYEYAMWNIGCEEIGGLVTDRDVKTLGTFKDLLNAYLVQNCLRLIWDAENENYIISYVNFVGGITIDAYPAPNIDNDKMDEKIKQQDFHRDVTLSRNLTANKYDYNVQNQTHTIEDASITTIITNSIGTLSGKLANNYYQVRRFGLNNDLNYDSPIPFTSTLIGGIIFDHEYLFTTYSIPFVAIEDMYNNISSCQAVFKNGIYILEIELYEVV